ncbi:hypothetical protein WKK05_10040 [Nostoc sp. UHCC 0302]|uniref:hypothetical protein n=1 Tax=Nostoc sp. UHCC 0302 TaxID=3134896 RepID=UPI00311CBE92
MLPQLRIKNSVYSSLLLDTAQVWEYPENKGKIFYKIARSPLSASYAMIGTGSREAFLGL